MADASMIWKPEFALGVEQLDNAHKELFLVIDRFQTVIDQRNEEYRKSFCASMMRYLVKYASTHFAEEEAYMLRNAYDGYEGHKQLHENFKKNVIPHLRDMLEEQKYSDDAIRRLIAVLSSWLTSHILVEDHAINGVLDSKWDMSSRNLDLASRIDREFRIFTEDLFGLQMDLVNRHYEGEYLGEQVYSFYCTSKGPTKYKALLLFDYAFIEYVVKHVVNVAEEGVTEEDVQAFEMIATSWAKASIALVAGTRHVEIEDVATSRIADYGEFFAKNQPQQSLLWRHAGFQVAIAIKVTE